MTRAARPVLLYLYTRLSPETGYREVAFPGGAQRRLFQLASHFNANGFEVVVASDDPPDSKAVAELAGAGILHHRLGFTRHSLAATAQSLRALFRLARLCRADIIHSHHRRTTLLSFLVTRLTGIPMIHNARLSFGDKKYFGFFAGKHVIAVSKGTGRNLVEHFGVPQEAVTVIYNGVSIDEPTPEEVARCREGLGLEENARAVTFVGRISEQKGLIHLIRALPAVLKSHPLFRLLIVGGIHERPIMDELEAEIARLGVGHALRFLGHHDRVAPYVSLAEFTVLPSLREGLPGTAIESLLLGRAVAATAVDGTPEVVSHGVDGLLVPPADPVRLAEALKTLLDDPEGTRDMGARGRLKAQKTFTMDLMYKAYGDYYRNLLGN